MLPVANPAVIFKAMSDGAVLFDPGAEVYFGLNEVGARIWELLPPACNALDELCAHLVARYPEVPEATLRQDVAELLDALAQQGLVIVAASSGQDSGAPPARAS